MTIRDKLRLATFIAIGVSLLAGFSVVSRNAAISELVEDNRIASEVVKGVFDLTILTNEYSLRHEQRTRHQWWSRYESNGELLRQAAASGHLESETLLGDLSKHHEGNGENFSRLENALGETSKDATSLALQQRLVGRLSIGAQEIVSRSLTLAKHSRRTLADEQRQLGIFLALSIIGLALVVTIGSLFINRGILKSLGILQQGAEIVGTGDLNHRIGATTRDEFGQLAHAFDQMTENVSASRDELEKEVGERKRAEAVLAQQAEELERSNQELDSFAHTASHDLKAPARRMAQFCQLLERKCKGVLDEKASGYISIIADNAAQMRTLIDDVLVFAKAGTGPREVGAVDLNTVARRAKTNLEMEIAESGAEVQVDILPTVAGHETDILLLFQNLIANAVKFCGENTPKVTVAAHLTDDVWDIEVRDNGIGIDATNQERIFAPLTRLHTAGEYQGSGIGLATCKKIVERNGGQIRVTSKSGCGSSFHFTLPTSTTNEAA